MKNAVRLWAASTVALCVFGAAIAQSQGPALKQLLPMEADVIGAAGTVALELPDDVVAACRADLSDLRLFDLEDREIPFVFDAGAPIGAPPSAPQVAAAKVLEIDREEIHRKDGPPLQREIYEIALAPDAPDGVIWELQIDSSHPHFVRQTRIGALEGGEAIVSTESVFRLPGSDRIKTRLSLPDPDAKHLRVVLEGEEGFFLEPRFSFHSELQVDHRPPIVVTLEEILLETDGGRTVVASSRPSGIVPARVRIDTTSAWFDRGVEIWDVRRGFPDRRLGSGRIRRMQDTMEPDDCEVRVDAAQGQQLRVVIDGGDSPPLANLKVIAVAPRPRLIFVAQTVAPDGRVGVLRFGGGRAQRPQYDIGLPAAAAPDSEPPRIGAAGPTAALIGDIHANSAYQAAPSLSFAMHAGAVVDERLFAHTRIITVAPSGEGLSRFRLDANDLAIVRPDLGDVRIVDAELRQWPYLASHETHLQEIPLTLVNVVHANGTSRYSFMPPAQPTLLGELVIDTDVQFIDRGYELQAVAPEREAKTVSVGKLNRGVGERTSPRISFAPLRVDSLALIVKNGDDNPLDIRGARSVIALPEIFLVAPAGKYTLLLGYPEAEAPQYEVAQAREAVLTAAAGEVTKGSLEPNPQFSQRARLAGGAARRTLPQILLWAALGVAVLVLGIVTARIVRSEPPAADSRGA